MDAAVASTAGAVAVASAVAEKETIVDPFLIEALQNPRHRLTILRMELDIQRFLQNPEQQQFEFQHFPTSYLRLAAHRVAHHYGLITMVKDSGSDGIGNRILVRKTADSRYPSVQLSEIPSKQLEGDKLEHIRVAIKPRPCKGSRNETSELEKKHGPSRSVEKRKEEYDKARARIFNGLTGPESDCSSSAHVDGMNTSPSRFEDQASKTACVEAEKNFSPRESAPTSRVAIFRDREKDRFDPDYDRSYERYVRGFQFNQNFSLAPFNMQKIQPPFYDTFFPQYGQMPSAPASLNFGSPGSSIMSPYGTTGLSQTSRDAMYMHWPNAAMMYAHSYEQFRNATLEVQFCQQPLSFDHPQNH